MPGTTARGFRYLSPTDPPDLAAGTQNLATDVDTYFGNYAPSTGRLRARTSTLNCAPNTEIPVGAYDVGDVYNVGDISYGSGYYTVATAGLYRWSATFYAVGSTTASTRAGLYVWRGTGGAAPTAISTYHEGRTDWALLTGWSTTVSAGGPIAMAAGDTLQLIFYHTDSAYLNLCIPRTFGLARVGR